MVDRKVITREDDDDKKNIRIHCGHYGLLDVE